MKKLFEKLSSVGCLLPLIICAVLPVVTVCVRLWEKCNGNIGCFLINLLILPFVVIGVINIGRGFFAVIEKDGVRFYGEKEWKVGLYLVITMAGYAAVFYAITQWIN